MHARRKIEAQTVQNILYIHIRSAARVPRSQLPGCIFLCIFALRMFHITFFLPDGIVPLSEPFSLDSLFFSEFSSKNCDSSSHTQYWELQPVGIFNYIFWCHFCSTATASRRLCNSILLDFFFFLLLFVFPSPKFLVSSSPRHETTAACIL